MKFLKLLLITLVCHFLQRVFGRCYETHSQSDLMFHCRACRVTESKRGLINNLIVDHYCDDEFRYP